MNIHKPLFLLAGGRGSNNQAIFKSIFKDTRKTNPVVAYVGAANGDDQRFFGFMGAEIQGVGKCTLNQVLLASKKADLVKAKAVLSSADAIFISGGDVEVGVNIIHEKGLIVFFRSLFDQGKLFFGVSAGSIMLAEQWVRWSNPDDDSTANLFSCLGLAPVICDTHAEEDNWVELKTAIQLKGNGSIGYGIPSGACLKVKPDGNVEAIGNAVTVFAQNNKKVVRRADLVPST
jgi:peptidase E